MKFKAISLEERNYDISNDLVRSLLRAYIYFVYIYSSILRATTTDCHWLYLLHCQVLYDKYHCFFGVVVSLFCGVCLPWSLLVVDVREPNKTGASVPLKHVRLSGPFSWATPLLWCRSR